MIKKTKELKLVFKTNVFLTLKIMNLRMCLWQKLFIFMLFKTCMYNINHIFITSIIEWQIVSLVAPINITFILVQSMSNPHPIFGHLLMFLTPTIKVALFSPAPPINIQNWTTNHYGQPIKTKSFSLLGLVVVFKNKSPN
jgi:hypothetical protein